MFWLCCILLHPWQLEAVVFCYLSFSCLAVVDLQSKMSWEVGAFFIFHNDTGRSFYVCHVAKKPPLKIHLVACQVKFSVVQLYLMFAGGKIQLSQQMHHVSAGVTCFKSYLA